MEIYVIKHNLEVFRDLKNSEKLSVDKKSHVSVDYRYWQALRRSADTFMSYGASSRDATYKVIEQTYNSLANHPEFEEANETLIEQSFSNLLITQVNTYPDFNKLITMIEGCQRQFNQRVLARTSPDLPAHDDEEEENDDDIPIEVAIEVNSEQISSEQIDTFETNKTDQKNSEPEIENPAWFSRSYNAVTKETYYYLGQWICSTELNKGDQRCHPDTRKIWEYDPDSGLEMGWKEVPEDPKGAVVVIDIPTEGVLRHRGTNNEQQPQEALRNFTRQAPSFKCCGECGDCGDCCDLFDDCMAWIRLKWRTRNWNCSWKTPDWWVRLNNPEAVKMEK